MRKTLATLMSAPHRPFSAIGSEKKASLVRQLSESRNFTVGDILTDSKQNVSTVHGTSSLTEAAAIMVQEEVGSIMVTCAKTHTLTGLLTERDYLRANQNGNGNKQIKDIMTPREQLVTVTADASVTECVTLMAEHPFRHLPVLEGDVLMGTIDSRKLLVSFLR
jgi:CBS domain-containing protein